MPKMKALSISSNEWVDAPSTEAQHADPCDLVKERRRARNQRRPEDHSAVAGLAPCRPPPWPERRVAAGCGWTSTQTAIASATLSNPAVMIVPGRPDRADQVEAAGEHAECSAEAVGEIEHREGRAGPIRIAAHDAAAHQRECHSRAASIAAGSSRRPASTCQCIEQGRADERRQQQSNAHAVTPIEVCGTPGQTGRSRPSTIA